MVIEAGPPKPIAAKVEAPPAGEPVKSFTGLEKALSASHDCITLARGKGLFKETQQPFENDPRLDSISDPDKKKIAVQALATQDSQIVRALETMDDFEKAVVAGTAEKDVNGQYTGKYTLKSDKKMVRADGSEYYPEKTGDVTDAYIGTVRGLKRVIAETEGSTESEQQALNTNAKTALADITSNVRVDTQSAKDIPLTEWETQVKQKGLELWILDNPSGTEAVYNDSAKTNPLVKYAYETRAENELDPQVKYRLVYAEATQPASPQPPTPATEAPPEEVPTVPEASLEKRRENAIRAAQAVQLAFSDREQSDSNLKSNRDFALLSLYRNLLVQGKGDPDTLISMIADKARACSEQYGKDTGFTGNDALNTALDTLKGNDVYYNQPGKEPTTTSTQELFTVLGVPEDQIQTILKQIESGKLDIGKTVTFMGELQDAIQADRKDPQRVKSYVIAAIVKATGSGTLTPEEGAFLKGIYTSGNIEYAQDYYNSRFGIHPSEVADLRKYLKTREDSIVRQIYPDIDKRKDKVTIRQAIGRMLTLSDDDILELKKEKGTLGDKLLKGGMGLMGIGMLLSMFQRTLENRGDTPEQGQPG